MKILLFKNTLAWRLLAACGMGSGMSGMEFTPPFLLYHATHATHDGMPPVLKDQDFFGGGYTASHPKTGGLAA